MTEPKDIIEYWIGSAARSPDAFARQLKLWYTSSPETDLYIELNFGETLKEAGQGNLSSWQQSIDGALALVIVFDQFSRNLFRGTSQAYWYDDLALAVLKTALVDFNHQSLDIPSRVMLYHPLHHSEDLDDQDLAVAYFDELQQQAPLSWRSHLEGTVGFIHNHRDVIKNYGRFPHRNKVLGRSTTAQEQDFLSKDARTYGQ